MGGARLMKVSDGYVGYDRIEGVSRDRAVSRDRGIEGIPKDRWCPVG